MPYLRTRIATLLVVLTTAGGARLLAQGTAPSDSLLDRLTAEATAARPALNGQRALARAADLRTRPAGALPDPMLTVGVMDLVLPNFAFHESDFTEVDFEIGQEFPWPGTRSARSRGAEAMARGAAAGVLAQERDTRVRVAMLYYRLRYLLAARETLVHQRSLLASAVEIATSRYSTGSVPQTDPLQARVALARLDADEAGLVEEEAGLRAELAAIRNVGPGELLPVIAIDPASVPRLSHHPAGGDLSAALEEHPLLQAQQAMIEAADETARAEHLGARPDFAVSARYGARPLGSDFFSAFVGIRIPLWAGRKQSRLADAAESEAQAARSQLEEQRARLTADATTTLAQVRASEARITILVDRILPASEETVQAALRGYRVGQGDFLSLLAAQDGLYRTELEAADLAAEHFTHLVMLEQLLGQGASQ